MKLSYLIFWLLPNVAVAAAFLERHENGLFWYKPNPAPQIKTEKPSLKKSQSHSATDEMNTLQKRVTESLNLAILNPTRENLKNYAKNYYEVIERGQRFSDAHKMMLLYHPEYDYSLKFPTNHNARMVEERRVNQAMERAVREFAKNHGFFFFFSSHCEFCHHFAPTVKRFADKFRIAVMAITLDGKALPQFPNAVPDNGTAEKLNVKTLPALFAVNPKTRQIVPLTNGMVSVSDLEETVYRYSEFFKKYGALNE